MQTTTTTVSMFSIMLSALLALTLLSPLAAAHSWVEEYQIISDNGSFTGPRGYLRGYVSRTDPTYNGFSMMWMLPSLEARNTDGTVRTRIDDTDLVCHPAQRTSNYTAAYPKLKVSPGDYVAMKYLENGHVSLPWNITGKPPGGGTVFIFGTTKASDEEKIADVMQWTRDGKGGNGNGFLMTAQNYDDGRCHQINCGSISQSRQILQPNHVAGQPTSTVESWCENDLLIPESVSPGTLTTYWIWQFGTEPNTDCNTPAGKDEYYTSCADFDVIDKAELSKQLAATPASASAAGESNPQTAAVSDYKSRTAYTTAPSYVLMSNNKLSGPGSVAPVNSAFVSSCSAQASIISANNLNVWPEVYVPNTCGVISSFGTEAAKVWSKTWDVEASSYTAGASSAWGAAFKAAGMEVPGRVPTWSVVPSATGSAGATATASGYGGAEPASTSQTAAAITSTSAAAPPAATSAPVPSSYSSGNAAAAAAAAAGMTTIITVVTLTSTLPVSQMSSVSVSSSASASSSSSSPSPSSSSSPSGPILSIPTISTVSVSSPPSAASASAPGYAPTVAANGTVNYLRHRRAHARNFFFGRLALWRGVVV